MAKAAVSLLTVVGKTTRRFESFPSPPLSATAARPLKVYI